MLKLSLSSLIDSNGYRFYLFNAHSEDVSYSIPLNPEELSMLCSCLGACLYEGIREISLEGFSISQEKNNVYIKFICHVPILGFKCQRVQAIGLHSDMQREIDATLG